MRISIGPRTLIAGSCRKCGKLFDGNKFHRHRRNFRDRIAYLDQRCANCKWGAKLKGRVE